MPNPKPRRSLFHPYNFAPLLILIAALLLIIGWFIPVGEYGIVFSSVLMSLFQFLVFGFPIFLYAAVRPQGSVRAMFGEKLRASSFSVIVCGSVLLILQSTVLKFGVFFFGYDVGVYTLYGTRFDVGASSVSELFAIVIGYAVLPAVAEEIFFRGVLTREYRIGGPLCSALISALFFAFIHFDLKTFPICFCAGLTLSGVAFITGSVAASMAVHAAYNLFSVFLEQYVWQMSSGEDSRLLFWFLLISLFLLSAYLFFRLAGAELRRAAEEDRIYPVAKEGVSARSVYAGAFTSPTMLICLAVCTAALVFSAFT